MANPDDPRESSESQILTHTLLKLRMHEGLAPARLQRDHRNTAPLLNLPAVQLLAATNDIEPSEAALEVVRRAALLRDWQRLHSPHAGHRQMGHRRRSLRQRHLSPRPHLRRGTPDYPAQLTTATTRSLADPLSPAYRLTHNDNR